jgi:hypothetical protein
MLPPGRTSRQPDRADATADSHGQAIMIDIELPTVTLT